MKTVEVRVPVPVPCVTGHPAQPAITSDDELKMLTDYQVVLAIRRNELLLRGYTRELQAILLACQNSEAPSP